MAIAVSKLKASPILMTVAAISSIQMGSAVAKGLLQTVDPIVVTLMRVGFSAIAFHPVWWPQYRQYTRQQYVTAAIFGLSIAGTNFFFYQAISRIPLGLAVTLEFLGPLGVAIAHSRRAIDVLWVLLAAAGIVGLAPIGGFELDPVGMGFALVAGGCWAGYVLCAERAGKVLPPGQGVTLALVFSTLAILGLSAGDRLLQQDSISTGFTLTPHAVLLGLLVAMLSSGLPLVLEVAALKRLPVRIFGVLLSLEPAIAAGIGAVFLNETLTARVLGAISLVVLASAGASSVRPKAETPPTDA
ncbi:MAG: EamA family transporter [Cyanobacteria bacterium J06648_11]